MPLRGVELKPEFLKDFSLGVGGILILLLAILLGFGLYFGGTCLITWLVVLVFGGFGITIPFWATFGAVVLVQLILGAVGAHK